LCRVVDLKPGGAVLDKKIRHGVAELGRKLHSEFEPIVRHRVTFACASVSLQCQTYPDPLEADGCVLYSAGMPRSYLRIAHRGASGSAPELTMAAFGRALDLGVDMIELDVQLSRDEQLVVLHDPDLDRTTDGCGPVRQKDLATLKTLDAGRWYAARFTGERIPTLSEVLEFVAGRARLNVEIKAPSNDWGQVAKKLVEVLGVSGRLEETIVSCFQPEALVAVRRESPLARIGLLWESPAFDDCWRWTRELGALSVHPHWLLMNPDLVSEAHRLGLLVLVWTVNDLAAMRELVRFGVDGIMSDFPETFARVEP